MNLQISNMPEEPQELARWLEQQLVGLQLRDVVIELLALTGKKEDSATLESVLGPQLPGVLQSGLGTLSPVQLRSLVQHPRLLLPLFDRIAQEGGDYWATVERTNEHQQAVDRGWQRLASQLPQASAPSPAKRSPTGRAVVRSESTTRNSWLIPLGIAVVLLLGLAYLLQPPPPNWGFDQSGLLTADVSASEYLLSLADAASQWDNKRPLEQTQLEKRLQQFHHGCQTLIAAKHPQLAPADREWLVERCQVWANKLEQLRLDLHHGRKTFEVAQQEADATIDKLIAALQKRAASVG